MRTTTMSTRWTPCDVHGSAHLGIACPDLYEPPKWRLATVEDTSIPCPHCGAKAGARCRRDCPARGGV